MRDWFEDSKEDERSKCIESLKGHGINEVILERAESGDVEAILQVGKILCRPSASTDEKNFGRKLYKMGADAGDAQCMNLYALHSLYHGLQLRLIIDFSELGEIMGTFKKALRYAEKALELGEKEAQGTVWRLLNELARGHYFWSMRGTRESCTEDIRKSAMYIKRIPRDCMDYDYEDGRKVIGERYRMINKVSMWEDERCLQWENEAIKDVVSHCISFFFRFPETIELTVDSHGWAQVDKLLEGLNVEHLVSMEMLEELVEKDEHQHFFFDETKQRIRANQECPSEEDEVFVKKVPPARLYYGTAQKDMELMEQQEMVPKSGVYVKLYDDYEAAAKEGRRHGEPVVYYVDCEAMVRDGLVFYRFANCMWWVDEVPVKYLKRA